MARLPEVPASRTAPERPQSLKPRQQQAWRVTDDLASSWLTVASGGRGAQAPLDQPFRAGTSCNQPSRSATRRSSRRAAVDAVCAHRYYRSKPAAACPERAASPARIRCSPCTRSRRRAGRPARRPARGATPASWLGLRAERRRARGAASSAVRYSSRVEAGSPVCASTVARPRRRAAAATRRPSPRGRSRRRASAGPRERHAAAVAARRAAGRKPCGSCQHLVRQVEHLRQAQLLALVEVRRAGQRQHQQRRGAGPAQAELRRRRSGWRAGSTSWLDSTQVAGRRPSRRRPASRRSPRAAPRVPRACPGTGS